MDEMRNAAIKEMLGLTDLPFIPQSYTIVSTHGKPPELQITFKRPLTPYEAEQYQRIITKRPWYSHDDEDD